MKIPTISFNVQGPHFLCRISGVVPLATWLISGWEENECWSCHFVSCSACKNSYVLSSQHDISDVLNGTTPEIQHRKWGPYTVAHTIDCVCNKMLNHGLKHGSFLSLFKLIPCPIHWIVCVLACLNFIFEF